jgi:uncharacterized protein (TIGR01244 family)
VRVIEREIAAMARTDLPTLRGLPLAAAVLALAWLAAVPLSAQQSDLPNRKDPLAGITTAGQPTAPQLEAAAAAGFKSIIDLRGTSEDRGMDETAVAARLGMSYANLPVDGAGGVTFTNAAALDKLLATAKRPVLIHCSTGNRAGALLALRAMLGGEDAATALALGTSAGLAGLKPTVEKKLAVGHD